MPVAQGLLGSFFTVACSVWQLRSALSKIYHLSYITLANISSSYSLILVLGFTWKTPGKTFDNDSNSHTTSHHIHKYFIYFFWGSNTFRRSLLRELQCVCVGVWLVFLWKIDCLFLVPVHIVRLADVKSVFLCLQLFIISFVIVILRLAVMGGGVKRMGGGRRHRGGSWVSETRSLIFENWRNVCLHPETRSLNFTYLTVHCGLAYRSRLLRLVHVRVWESFRQGHMAGRYIVLKIKEQSGGLWDL